MKVYCKCHTCKKEITSKTWANTRLEIAMKEGEAKRLQCKHCLSTDQYHVDELYAKESKIALIIAALFLFVGTSLVFVLIKPYLLVSRNHYFIKIAGSSIILPGNVFSLIRRGDRRRVRIFNRLNLKGKIHRIDYH